MRIAVIDGQGGGVGKLIVEGLCKRIPPGVEILALGTNALATAAMLKAGAHIGASGENAIVFNMSRVDFILGTIGIIMADSMLGELTPNMAQAVASSPAPKILIPLNRCGVEVIGISSESLPELVRMLVDKTVEAIAI
jgi:hypothetical protein